MGDLAFYNAGCHEPRGARRAVVPFRRLVRRLLRPIFLRQVALLQDICDRLDRLEHAEWTARERFEHLGREEAAGRERIDRLEERIDRRQDALAAQVQTSIALGWDYVATVRRLAVLEDRVEALLTRDRTGDARPSIPFPDPETDRAGEDQDEARRARAQAG